MSNLALFGLLVILTPIVVISAITLIAIAHEDYVEGGADDRRG